MEERISRVLIEVRLKHVGRRKVEDGYIFIDIAMHESEDVAEEANFHISDVLLGDSDIANCILIIDLFLISLENFVFDLEVFDILGRT